MLKRARTYMIVVLLVACGKSGSMDMGHRDLATEDLARRQDLAAVDLAGVDAGMKVDLSTTDLATTDLATTDLAAHDMATTDMAMTDMAAHDMALIDMAAHDMATTDMAATDMAAHDMADMSSPDMAKAGAIGAPCTMNTNCTGGTMGQVCWASNLLNNPMDLPTPNGYCSATCTVDADCGTGAVCANLGMAGSFCLAQCMDAMTCRHPGYACAFYTNTYGVCFPVGIFNCDPTVATCTEAGTGKPGGCLRGAYENDGNCAASCTPGVGTCAAYNGTSRECNYYIAAEQYPGDAWSGLICLPQPATPVATGGACMYINACVDGDQCDPTSGKCAQMCIKGAGGMPACGANMTCTDIWMTPATGPGLCH